MPRPQTFDPDQALDRAIDLFWRHGYEGTSVQDLVLGMGINRFSLYGTFKDKDTLFRRACAAYSQRYRETTLAPLDADPRGLASIEAFLEGMLDYEDTVEGPYGCLIVNTLVERGPHDEEIRAMVADHFGAVEASLGRALARAEAAGELKPVDLPSIGRLLLTLWMGQAVQRKLHQDRATAAGVVRAMLDPLRA